MIDWAGRLTPYPTELIERFRALGLWGDRPLASEFHEVALRQPDHVALATAERSVTYAELDEVTDRLALGLHGLGLEPGDRVIVQLSNQCMTVIAWYGMLKAGLIPVCTLAAHRGHEIGSISRKVEAVAHLVEHTPSGFDLVRFAAEQAAGHPTMHQILTIDADEGAPGARLEDLIAAADPAAARALVDDLQKAIEPEEIAVFQLSGGTTGVPKIIPRLHAEYWYNAKVYAEARGWDETSRVAHLIPIIHNAGIVCGVHAAHAVGGTLVLSSANLDQALPVLIQERATAILIGHAHYGIVNHPLFDEVSTTMKQVLLSGAKVPEKLFEAFERRGVAVGQKFGMGEGLFTSTGFDSPRTLRLTSVGLPISPEDEFKVIDPDTAQELPDGEPGELICRGPYTIRGYFDAPEINQSAFIEDGFYRSGDLVKVINIDGMRSISMEGRIKDLINRGGEKISAEEVEGLLVKHPRITAAAVVAMPDERLGEKACAYLVSNGEPLTMAEVQAHLQSLGVAKFKWPERLERIDQMPKTPVGKLNKKELHQDLLARLARAMS
ncbi:AMP-binding protein [Nocardioides panzhihuensis]|uniref:2,3-dihydroxybenzoate-AMP ligase n=1 Tax=Nocardioides panzhihuensis TaxID=860243 RepID=A0A7Z0DRM6_9ACTN|nr:2,3-dihydroxybenzoate-AMP ligase [Nocardioides panzhihuensis]